MARPKKEEKEEENWLIENELQLRSEIPYTFFENIPIAYNGVFEQCFQKYLNTFDKNIF